MVVHTLPENLNSVEQSLNQMDGVEVRMRDQRGKLIVLIDHPERKVVSDTMMNMFKVDGVLNASLIYEYFEDDDGDSVEAELPFSTSCTPTSCSL